MRRIQAVAIASPFATYGWLVSASVIYLWGTDKLDLFRFPYAQWIEVAPWWRLNWRMTVWVSLSAIVPALLAGMALYVIWKVTGGAARSGSTVYGQTDWATDHQRKTAGINSSRRPF